MKSYVKFASGLLLSGTGIAALERMLAGGMAQANMSLPAGSGWLVTGMALAPLALIGAGILVYIGGAVLGLK